MNKLESFPRFLSIAALGLISCSDDADGQAVSEQNGDQFLTPEEQAKSGDQQDDADMEDSASDSDPSSDSQSNTNGTLIVDGNDGAWDIPNDGADFTGPPLDPSDGPETSEECEPSASAVRSAQGQTEATCFYGEGDPDTPAARIDQVVEVVDGTKWVHVRLTLNPNFVDNSYGETAIGWSPGADDVAAEADKKARKKKGGHTFKDLVGSDHAEMKITDASGDVVMHFKMDYISEDEGAPSGYASQGVTGGEGKMIEGNPDWVLAATTSLARNLNGCGLESYLEDSPLPASADRAMPQEADWDYRVVYEVWISADAFGDEGVGEAFIEFVHASPSKAEGNSVDVTPGDCPPEEEPPSDDEPADDDPMPPDGAAGSPGDTEEGGAAGNSPPELR